VPNSVVGRAKEILHAIETGEMAGGGARNLTKVTAQDKKKHPSQLSLFETPVDPLRSYLQKITMDDLSPRQALEVLYELDRIANT